MGTIVFVSSRRIELYMRWPRKVNFIFLPQVKVKSICLRMFQIFYSSGKKVAWCTPARKTYPIKLGTDYTSPHNPVTWPLHLSGGPGAEPGTWHANLARWRAVCRGRVASASDSTARRGRRINSQRRHSRPAFRLRKRPRPSAVARWEGGSVPPGGWCRRSQSGAPSGNEWGQTKNLAW